MTTRFPERPRSRSPNHVTFQNGNGLLAQLKAIVLQAEVEGEGGLLHQLRAFVASFASENNKPAPQHAPHQIGHQQRSHEHPQTVCPNSATQVDEQLVARTNHFNCQALRAPPIS